MKNGTIILTINKGSKWYSRLVLWFIRKVSKSPYTHVQVWLNGYLYETAHPGGFKKRNLVPEKKEGKTFLEPITPLTYTQEGAIIAYFDDKIRNGVKYNYAKLFLSFLLFWSKPFWEKIKMVPFQDDKRFGDFCSAAVDEAYKFAGIDLLESYEEITAPGDFLKSKLLKEV